MRLLGYGESAYEDRLILDFVGAWLTRAKATGELHELLQE